MAVFYRRRPHICDKTFFNYFYLFVWYDAMTAYKQIMPRFTTALTGMQKYNKIYTPLSDVTHCDKQNTN